MRNGLTLDLDAPEHGRKDRQVPVGLPWASPKGNHVKVGQ